jgi:hypothetical protein
MKLQALGLMTILVFSSAAVYAKTAKKPIAVPEYPPAQVKKLLFKIREEKKQCLKPVYQRPPVCRSGKLLDAFEGVLVSYLEVQERAESELAKQKEIQNKNDYLSKQTEMIRTTLKDMASQNPSLEKTSCYKPFLLKKIMLDEGITENGGILFSKHPLPSANGICWSNSKKKKEASIYLCNFPQAISIDTRGGTDRSPTRRHKEFLFSLDGCDLLSVHIHDSDRTGERESFISYDQCMEKWNKRTADALMSSKEVALMEDTIGFCFREYLLPPRTEKNGKINPIVRLPSSGQKPN